GDPAGESRGGSPTARGKRVPGVEINIQIVQAIKIDKLDFHRVCLQSGHILIGCAFFVPYSFCLHLFHTFNVLKA
ncbi:hypothetical protein L3139_14595, partial [[Brevibacterium] frigoritolerans]